MFSGDANFNKLETNRCQTQLNFWWQPLDISLKLCSLKKTLTRFTSPKIINKAFLYSIKSSSIYFMADGLFTIQSRHIHSWWFCLSVRQRQAGCKQTHNKQKIKESSNEQTLPGPNEMDVRATMRTTVFRKCSYSDKCGKNFEKKNIVEQR